MDSELINLRKSVLSLISKLSKDDLNIKLQIVEYILTDYGFFEDSEEIVKLTPAQILNDYLETFYLEHNNQRLYSEWFTVLALYWLKKIDELRSYKDRPLKYCHQAHNLAQGYIDKANQIDGKIKRRTEVENRALSKRLSDMKYAPNRRLKKFAFREYKLAYKQLKQEGKRVVTYGAIAKRILPIIKKHNIHPDTGEKIIGRDKKDGTPGDVIGALIKWFNEGVREKLLESTRKK